MGPSALVKQPVLAVENSDFKPTLLCLKIDLGSRPVRVGGVG